MTLTLTPIIAANAILIVAVLLGFGLGNLWTKWREKRKIKQGLDPHQQIISDDLERMKQINKELANKTRALEAKEIELTLTNRRLQKLEEAKSKFVAVTTHQLRTPLSAIKWTFNMIITGQLGPLTPDQKTFLDKGYQSTERMIKIVNDLLNLDQIEAERKDYNFIPVKLEELIESVTFEFENQAESKKIDLSVQKPGKPLPAVEADPLKLRLVFENLIDNAIKYNHFRGKVTIIISDDNLNTTKNSVEIVISDTGIGIPPAERDKIFGKFFRAGNAVAVEPDGSGLGLYLSRDIIEKHNGTITFQSKDEGTDFHISLPLHQPR